MKKEEPALLRFKSLTDAHRQFGLPNPKHPLISMLNSDNQIPMNALPGSHVLTFYKIAYKPGIARRLKYGQHYYDFAEGGLFFAAPNQIIGNQSDDEGICSEYTLLIHPDFFLNYPLAKKIKQYGFFSYSTNEALHLSEEEKTTIISIFHMIEGELNSRIDDFSQDVVISQIELLLNYANRFYRRQFITRKAVHSDLLEKLEEVLDDYFINNRSLSSGLPSVQYLADQLNVSPSYLSDMLRSLTGQSAQQHIHHRLIEEAKERLSTSTLSVSQIAYELGFEHPQSFSKLFKTKTEQTPLAFRQRFLS
ncbi:helix-turn-helix domain-containing protein [Pedobacter deserti]|uniref:helix-turn-helix domain-containing protein n=1 Tax=Pedobacter deserti TaxID=2817382 RepID=UPI00210A6765|nr:helix-turn-helix transcriptional regulator [Pedobacter sp. SYSU D00382]